MEKLTILVVEDDELNREILTMYFEDKYNILQAENGKEAIDILQERPEGIGAVLLDVQMPIMDGMQALEIMHSKGWMDKFPVIILSGDASDRETQKRAYKLGATDLIGKPYDQDIVQHCVNNAIKLYDHKNEIERKVEEQTAQLKQSYALLKKQADQLEKANYQIIDVMSEVVEFRNLESGDHVKRVKGFTNILAKSVARNYPEYELDDRRVKVITAASALHDVGKICISDTILLKPGRLTPEEFDMMKQHTVKGCDIIDMLKELGVQDDEFRSYSYEIARHHHERYSGKGYPDGLVGEDIPISAQIVSVADVYDALVSERVYKKALPKDKAFEMIKNGECGEFSPKLMKCFDEVREEFELLADTNSQ